MRFLFFSGSKIIPEDGRQVLKPGAGLTSVWKADWRPGIYGLALIVLSLVLNPCFSTQPVYPVKTLNSLPGTLRNTPPATALPPSAPSGRLNLETQARQVLLIDYTTGSVLLEKNADELMYPSSMTKLMTALLVFDRLKAGHIQMDTVFPVSERAWRMEGSKMFVPLNAMVSVEDLLKGIIIQSGNDACIVMAEGLSGSEENFAEEMTRGARQLGALNTTFRNASGWPDPEHLTTARDLAVMAHHLIVQYPEYYGMFAVKEYVYNRIRQWNRNPLLYKNTGCDGIKTGYTKAGGYGMIASQMQDGRRLILVINGLPSEQARAQEALKLMSWGMQTFNNYPLFKAGDVVEKMPVWLGDKATVMATVASDVTLTLPRASRRGLKVDIQYDSPLPVPLEKDAAIGKMTVTYPAQETPLEIPLIAAEPVNRGTFFKRIRDSFRYLIWGKC